MICWTRSIITRGSIQEKKHLASKCQGVIYLQHMLSNCCTLYTFLLLVFALCFTRSLSLSLCTVQSLLNCLSTETTKYIAQGEQHDLMPPVTILNRSFEFLPFHADLAVQCETSQSISITLLMPLLLCYRKIRVPYRIVIKHTGLHKISHSSTCHILKSPCCFFSSQHSS